MKFGAAATNSAVMAATTANAVRNLIVVLQQQVPLRENDGEKRGFYKDALRNGSPRRSRCTNDRGQWRSES